MKKIPKRRENNRIFQRFLNYIEEIGNSLPHPITLFALFAFAVVILSATCAFLDVSAAGETTNPSPMELEKQVVSAVSLLTREGLSYMLTSAVSNFTSFCAVRCCPRDHVRCGVRRRERISLRFDSAGRSCQLAEELSHQCWFF